MVSFDQVYFGKDGGSSKISGNLEYVVLGTCQRLLRCSNVGNLRMGANP